MAARSGSGDGTGDRAGGKAGGRAGDSKGYGAAQITEVEGRRSLHGQERGGAVDGDKGEIAEAGAEQGGEQRPVHGGEEWRVRRRGGRCHLQGDGQPGRRPAKKLWMLEGGP